MKDDTHRGGAKHDGPVSRRWFLRKATVSGLAVGLAGCQHNVTIIPREEYEYEMCGNVAVSVRETDPANEECPEGCTGINVVATSPHEEIEAIGVEGIDCGSNPVEDGSSFDCHAHAELKPPSCWSEVERVFVECCDRTPTPSPSPTEPCPTSVDVNVNRLEQCDENCYTIEVDVAAKQAIENVIVSGRRCNGDPVEINRPVECRKEKQLRPNTCFRADSQLEVRVTYCEEPCDDVVTETTV